MRTHRISIRLHMQDHNIPLSLFIILVYILTVLVLWNIVSNGHVTVTSCLFLRYDPSTRPQKVWNAGKVLMHHHEFEIFFAFFNFQNGVLREGIWGGLRKIIFVSILHVISFCNYFKTTLKPNWLSRYLNFCSLSSTKPLLASVWRSNFYYESQNHVLAMHIIAHFFPIFWKFPEAVITKGEQGKRRGRRLEQRVEWRWMRSGRWSVVLWY